MPSSRRFGLFSRRKAPARTFTVHSPRGAIAASAARLDVGNRDEAKVQRMLRQGWQSDAWTARDTIGELRYAVNFLANTTARMRIYPACYPVGEESDEPVKLAEASGVPDQVVSLCAQAMQDLGSGRMALGGLMHGVSSNKTVAGEAWLLGRTDPQTREQRWSVRSVDELVVYDECWHLREVPDDRQNSVIPWIKLDPELDVISRMWTPHPRFQLLADAPTRAMLEELEALGILRRTIRAAGRSRLARSGVLAIPDEFSIKVPLDDDEDPEADPFMLGLTEAMMAPVVNEGSADSFVPIVLRGPGEMIAKIQQFNFSLDFDKLAAETRSELLGVIARTLDMPPEILTGIQDVNHWTAWAISDDTFRQIEPHVISCCDDLSAAYLRPYLAAGGIDDFWVQRMVLWYDPSEVVTHPDQTKDALDLHDRLVISDEAMLRVSGFAESDRPSKAEIQVRLLEKMRMWPPNLVMAFLHAWDPALVAPPITVAGTIPGIKPTGVDTGEPPIAPGAIAPPAGAPGASAAPAHPPPPPGPDEHGPPPAVRPDPSLTAAGARKLENSKTRRLSRKLAAIDSDLRARLQTAANAALLRALERAGARLRPKVAKDETLRSRIAHRSNERVSALLGPEAVAAAGFAPGDLIGSDWGGLRSQYNAWTAAAQRQAIQTALRIGGLDQSADSVAQADQAMAAGRDAGWELLSGALTSLGQNLLYSPDPNVGPGDWATLNPDTLVPTGTIRAALGVAGGADVSRFTADDTGAVTIDGPVGQIGTGATITDLLTSAGATQDTYTWTHGPSLHPFEPHENLDGTEFASFDDDALAVGEEGAFTGQEFYMPGDHDGCLCDFQPNWMSPGDQSPEEE